MKKFFLVTTSLFVVFLIFFLIYNFFFKNNPFDGKVPAVTIVENPTIEDDRTNDTQKAEMIIAPFVEEKASSLSFNTETKSLFFLSPDERALRETPTITGAPRTVITFPFTPQSIVWSPTGKRALVKQSATQWTLFDRETTTLTMLKTGIESPTWTTLGDKIVYKFYDPDTKKRTLTLANPDGSNWKVIGDARFQFLETATIPRSTSIAFWNRGNAFEKTSLSTVSTLDGSPKEIFTTTYGADYRFSPNGEKILTSGTVEKGSSSLSLALMNIGGSGYQNLFIPTLVSKTTWSKSGRTLYYALPGSIPTGSVLPNDYYEKPLLTSDTFWKMDTKTGESSRIVDTADITQSFDAQDFTLDDEESTLFFVNRRDNKIYRIRL